jgi:hypothetical protein
MTPKYVICPKEYISMARKDGLILEHRLVMAKHLGRALTKKEVVSHIDGNVRNNEIENLEINANNTGYKRAGVRATFRK